MRPRPQPTKPTRRTRAAARRLTLPLLIVAAAAPPACTSSGSSNQLTLAEYRAIEPERRRQAISLLRDANDHLAENEFQQAEDTYEQAIRVYDQVPAAWSNLGVAYLRQSEFVEADQAFQRAMELDPTDYRPAFNRGLMYFERGFLAESRRLFEAAIEADDAQLAPLWYAIRVDITLERETEQTLAHIERAMQLESDPQFLRRLRLERLRVSQLLDEDGPATSRRVQPEELDDVAPELAPEARQRLTPADPSPEQNSTPPPRGQRRNAASPFSGLKHTTAGVPTHQI